MTSPRPQLPDFMRVFQRLVRSANKPLIMAWLGLFLTELAIKLSFFADERVQRVLETWAKNPNTDLLVLAEQLPPSLLLIITAFLAIFSGWRIALWRPVHESYFKGTRFGSIREVLANAAPFISTSINYMILWSFIITGILAVGFALQAPILLFAIFPVSVAFTTSLYLAITRDLPLSEAFAKGISLSNKHWLLAYSVNAALMFLWLIISAILLPQAMQNVSILAAVSVFTLSTVVAYEFFGWLSISALLVCMDEADSNA